MTVEELRKRQDILVEMFTKKQHGFINEAINIEYTLTMVEQGYSLADIK